MWSVRERRCRCHACHHRRLPGLSARLQVHGDRGSVVIDNDKLTFIHLTPRESDAEERAYDQPDTAINQIAELSRGLGCCCRDRWQRPRPAGNRRPSPPIRELPRRTCRSEALRVDLQTNRQSIAIITGVYESHSHRPPGDPVTTSIGGGKPGAAPAGNALKLRAVIPGRGPGVVSRGEPAMVRCRW